MGILDNLEAYLDLDDFIDISEDIDKEDIQSYIDRLKSEFRRERPIKSVPDRKDIMIHTIIDTLILVGVWVNAYINIQHHIARKKRNL